MFTVVKDSAPTTGNNGHPFDFGGHSATGYTFGAGSIVYEDFGTDDRLGWNTLTGTVDPAAGDAGKAGLTFSGPAVDTGLYHVYSVHSAVNDWGVRFDGFTAAATSTNGINFTLAAGRE